MQWRIKIHSRQRNWDIITIVIWISAACFELMPRFFALFLVVPVVRYRSLRAQVRWSHWQRTAARYLYRRRVSLARTRPRRSRSKSVITRAQVMRVIGLHRRCSRCWICYDDHLVGDARIRRTKRQSAIDVVDVVLWCANHLSTY